MTLVKNRLFSLPFFYCINTVVPYRRNIFICLTVFLVLYSEVLIYYFASLRWYQLNCPANGKCTRILVVADPQIIGLHNEPLISPVSIWDCDRYLSKTYSHAYQFSQPDVVLFLGDLFDEGSTSTDSEFNAYARRLFDIFLSSSDNIRHVWLPGDNDIGGEAGDLVTPLKVQRFNRVFSQPDIVQVNNVKFYKINRLTSTVPKFSNKNDFANVDTIVVGASHIPLLMLPSLFVDKVLEKLQPHVLFTAHDHRSMIVSVSHDFGKDRLVTTVRPDEDKVHEYFLGISNVYEFMVPTCSYRMGTGNIGYGLALIDGETIKYTVLWSPSRFPQLILYGLLVIVALLYIMFRQCRYWVKRCTARVAYRPV